MSGWPVASCAHLLLLLAPLTCFALLVLHALQRAPAGATEIWRPAILHAVLVCGVALVVSSEALGALGWLGRWGIFGFWTTACVPLAWAVWRRREGLRQKLTPPPFPGMDLAALCALAAAAIAVVLLFVALVSAPNNWDSLTYHLSRVASWLEQRSLAHYPTHNLRQLYLGPFAEIAILQPYALVGGDRFVNAVQWCSMAGCCLGVSLLAAHLGASRIGQAFAALFCVTIPMGILQATSTQNDYVTSLMLVLAVLALFDFRTRPSRWSALAFGAGLGLAILTKATAYLYGLPFVIWFSVLAVRPIAARPPWWTRLGWLALPALTVVLLNLPHNARNAQLTGSLFSIGAGQYRSSYYFNAEFSLRSLASGLVKNGAIHFLQVRPAAARVAVVNAVHRFHAWIDYDINDPRTTLNNGRQTFRIRVPFVTEDIVGNPVHLVLALASTLLALVLHRRPGMRASAVLIVCLAIGGTLFCALLQWQPWASRLHLPLFVLVAAAVAYLGERLCSRHFLMLLALVMFGLGIPVLVDNASRPLIGPKSVLTESRLAVVFANQPATFDDYILLTAELCQQPQREIGLVSGRDDWEYPLWLLLKRCDPAFRLRHVDVSNPSARFDPGGPRPALVVHIDNRQRIARIEPAAP